MSVLCAYAAVGPPTQADYHRRVTKLETFCHNELKRPLTLDSYDSLEVILSCPPAVPHTCLLVNPRDEEVA